MRKIQVMKHFLPAILLIFFSVNSARAQQNIEEEAVKSTINLLFDGMRNSDTSAISRAFDPAALMQTIAKSKDGKLMIRNEKLQDFIKSVGAPHSEKYDERISFTKILIDENLASVWTDYKFYLGSNFSHCGVNSFQLFKGKDGWKIIYIIDTRRKNNCS
jgi:hypothetical protein